MKRLGQTILVVLILAMLVVTIGPFLVPVPPLKGTVPPEQLADPDSKFVDVNGLRVHYKEAGQGEPALILQHGFATSLTGLSSSLSATRVSVKIMVSVRVHNIVNDFISKKAQDIVNRIRLLMGRSGKDIGFAIVIDFHGLSPIFLDLAGTVFIFCFLQVSLQPINKILKSHFFCQGKFGFVFTM